MERSGSLYNSQETIVEGAVFENWLKVERKEICHLNV